MNATNWTALFVCSPSPGAVFRFLERRYLLGEAVPTSLLLSEPTAPHGWRLLTTEDAAAVSEHMGQSLSTAVKLPVTLLSVTPEGWRYITWQGGASTEERDEPTSAKKASVSWLARLPGLRPTEPYVEWAKERGFPVRRMRELLAGKARIVSYRTVSSLDERSLLVEKEPRLYRFDLPPRT